MTEQELWRKLLIGQQKFTAHYGKGCAHLVRVENALEYGFPDIDYCVLGAAGHMELKARRAWPKSGVVKCANFTAPQRQWLMRRHAAGGAVSVLWAVGTDVMLFSGRAIEAVGLADRMALLCRATWLADIKTNRAWSVELLKQLVWGGYAEEDRWSAKTQSL